MATITKPPALDETFNSTENTPRNIADVLADELDGIKQAINSQSGSGNGHIIQNSSGANMPSENTMQFVDAHLSDDSVGGKTVVETFKAVTEAEYSSETEDGAYIITDGDGATIEPASDDYVLAEADGTKTWQQLLNSIWLDADKSKITDNAYIYIDGTILSIVYKGSGQCIFSLSDISSQVPASSKIKLASNSTFEQYSSATYQNLTTNIASADVYLYYGNKKAIVDLQTTANRCWMSNGESVESAFTWKYLTNITDHNAHAINVNFRELFIIGLFGAISATLIPLVASTRSGYYSSSSDYGDMFATYANGGLTIVNYKINGTDQIARGVNVYYR